MTRGFLFSDLKFMNNYKSTDYTKDFGERFIIGPLFSCLYSLLTRVTNV